MFLMLDLDPFLWYLTFEQDLLQLNSSIVDPDLLGYSIISVSDWWFTTALLPYMV